MKPQIEKISATEKYKLFVRFVDGTEGVLDLGHLAGKGVFTNWDVQNNFFNVFISEESGAITWPNEIDIDPYNVYFKIRGINPEDYFRSKKEHAPHF